MTSFTICQFVMTPGPFEYFLAELFQQLCSLDGEKICGDISQVLSATWRFQEIKAPYWSIQGGHMTLEWDLTEMGMMWLFPPMATMGNDV